MIYHQNGYSLLPLLSSYQYYLQNNCPSPFRNIFLIWPLQQLQQSVFWCADLLKSAHKTGNLKLFFISDLNHGLNVWSKLWRQQQEWLEERMKDSRTDYLLTMSDTSGEWSQVAADDQTVEHVSWSVDDCISVWLSHAEMSSDNGDYSQDQLS